MNALAKRVDLLFEHVDLHKCQQPKHESDKPEDAKHIHDAPGGLRSDVGLYSGRWVAGESEIGDLGQTAVSIWKQECGVIHRPPNNLPAFFPAYSSVMGRHHTARESR